MEDDIQLRIVQAMTPEQKLKAAQRLWESAWQLKAAAIRTDHPEWTEEQVQCAVRDAFLYARD